MFISNVATFKLYTLSITLSVLMIKKTGIIFVKE